MRPLCLLSLALFLSVSAAATELLLERTCLPDAAPSAFAVGFPGGPAFCYDPVRGGLLYAWTGGFLDIASVRPANKLIAPAKLLGQIAYRERGPAPLRPGNPARVPLTRFLGYALRDGGIEFRSTIDGALVRELITASADGRTLTRRFTCESGAAPWWYLPGPSDGAAVRAPAATRGVEDALRFAAGEFTLEISLPSPTP